MALEFRKLYFALLRKVDNWDIMRKVSLVLWVLAIINFSAQGQTPASKLGHRWSLGNGGNNGDQLEEVVIFEDRIYVSGSFQNTFDVNMRNGTNTLISAGADDIYFAAYTLAGNVLWANRIGSTGVDVAHAINVDELGNVFITGRFEGTVDFDPSVAVVNLTSLGASAGFIAKYNEKGVLVWARAVTGTGNVEGRAVVADGAEDIYMAGNFTGTVDIDPSATTVSVTAGNANFDTYIIKFSKDGNTLWSNHITSNSKAVIRYLGISPIGKLNATGYYAGTCDVDPSATVSTLVSTSANDDAFVLAYEPNSGALSWAKSFGGTGTDNARSMDVEPVTGNIYVTGYFNSTAIMESNTVVSAGDNDVFLLKLKPNGTITWLKRIGGTTAERGWGISVDEHENFYVTGFYSGTADFDPDAGVFNLTSNGGQDVFVAKYDRTAALQWAFGMGGSADDNGQSIVADSLNVIITGEHRAAFTAYDATVPLNYSSGIDFWLARYNQCAGIEFSQGSDFKFCGKEVQITGASADIDTPVKWNVIAGETTVQILPDNRTANPWLVFDSPSNAVLQKMEMSTTLSSCPTVKKTLQITKSITGLPSLNLGPDVERDFSVITELGVSASGTVQWYDFGSGSVANANTVPSNGTYNNTVDQEAGLLRLLASATGTSDCASLSIFDTLYVRKIDNTLFNGTVSGGSGFTLLAYKLVGENWILAGRVTTVGSTFNLDGYPRGLYKLRCISTNAAFVPTYSGNALTWKEADIIDLSVDQVGLSLTMQPAPTPNTTLVDNYLNDYVKLGGRVYINRNGLIDETNLRTQTGAEDYKPLQDATLYLLSSDDTRLTQTTVDAEGFYSFAGLNGEVVQIFVDAPSAVLEGTTFATPEQTLTIDTRSTAAVTPRDIRLVPISESANALLLGHKNATQSTGELGLSVYYENGTAFIRMPNHFSGIGKLMLFEECGRLVHAESVSKDYTAYEVNEGVLKNGLYIAVLDSPSGQWSAKILIGY
jgi:hypothetical protein